MARSSKSFGQRGRQSVPSGYLPKGRPLLLGSKVLRPPVNRPGAFSFKTMRPKVVHRPVTKVNLLNPWGLFKAAVRQSAFDHVKAYRDVVCAKRKIRREVLMALEIAGRKGSGSGKHKHFNASSKVRC